MFRLITLHVFRKAFRRSWNCTLCGAAPVAAQHPSTVSSQSPQLTGPGSLCLLFALARHLRLTVVRCSVLELHRPTSDAQVCPKCKTHFRQYEATSKALPSQTGTNHCDHFCCVNRLLH